MIKNIATEGLEELLEILDSKNIHVQRIFLEGLNMRGDSHELMGGELVETANSFYSYVASQNIPNKFFYTRSFDEFGMVGNVTQGYMVDAEIPSESSPIRLIITKDILGLKLVMESPITLDTSNPVYVRDLPSSSYGVGMRFDFSDPNTREALRGYAETRVSVQYFSPGDNDSTMYGYQGEDKKYDVRVSMRLQKPKSEYLQCFVATQYSSRMVGGKLKNVEHADDIDDSNYQGDEGHYCITDEDKDTYELVPFNDIDETSGLTLELETVIGDWKESELPLFNVTGHAPITLGEPNDFYVRGYLGPGRFFEVRNFPEQDMSSNPLILYKRHSSIANLVAELDAGMQEMQSVIGQFEQVFSK